MVLANLGADIIKLEPPAGDIMRQVGPMKNELMGHSFVNANHGKRSLVLDLKKPEARLAALKLAETADVFVHNIRPAALTRLGLDYQSISAINPKIIFASAVGFGSGGRYSGKPAYDDLIQGIVGIPSLVLESGSDVPRYLPTPIADRSVALYLSSMISAALYAREMSGFGQYIEVPMVVVLSQYVLGDHMAGLN
jgi:crotonobetainyl-CoA:carnitine CoA-transferase CaiB-like acyl-CoA transferase